MNTQFTLFYKTNYFNEDVNRTELSLLNSKTCCCCQKVS